MSAVKVVYIIDFLTASGGEQQLMMMLRRLDRRRFDPYLVVLHGENDFPYHYRAEVEALNIPIYSLKMPFPPDLVHLPAVVLRYIHLIWRIRPHIVHGCLHVSNLITRMGRIFCPPHQLLNMVQSLHTPKRLFFERWTAFLCDKIIANSEKNYHHLIHNGKLSPKKVSYINCGVDYERFTTNNRPNFREQTFPDATFIALMVARIDPIKDHATVLTAIHQLKNDLPPGFRFIFIGEVMSRPTQEQIEALIEQYQLQPYIIQLPPTEDIVPYFHAADVTLLPSTREGFGLVVVESFAVGKPVIASDAANPLGIVKTGVTGWVFPAGDAAALARCLAEALQSSPEMLEQMGERARQEAPQYHVEAMVNSYMALYEA